MISIINFSYVKAYKPAYISWFFFPPLSLFLSFYIFKVSWIRKKDIHILTNEDFVFSGDSRFTIVHHPKDSIEWNLKIDNANQKDSGFYGTIIKWINQLTFSHFRSNIFIINFQFSLNIECQVNTEPKIKLSVYLEVTGEKLH